MNPIEFFRLLDRHRKIGNFIVIFPIFSLWIVGALSIKDVPMKQVVALVDDRTYLPCDISPDAVGEKAHLVVWYRDDRHGPAIYSVDARQDGFKNAEKWSDEKTFSHRANFIQDRDPAQLGIDNVREDDAGIYRCRVEFPNGQTRNSRVNLTVIVPPHQIEIRDEQGKIRGSNVGYYGEGDDVRLLCDVYGGKPLPSVRWYRNGNVIQNSSTVVDSTLTRSEILVKNLNRADVQNDLTCNATNSNRSNPLSAKVRLKVMFAPLTVNIIGLNKPLSAGKKVNIVCITSGSRPAAKVTWFKEHFRLNNSSESISSDGNSTKSILAFVPTKSDAGKRIFCRAENYNMTSKPIEDFWNLQIQYTPETQIQLGPSLNPDGIREGSDVYFDCLIKAEPPVYKVEWRHQNRTLNHNTSMGVIISNQSLVLQGIDRKSAGNYTCVGFNAEGSGQSSPFYLNVMFSPTCAQNQTKIYGVAKQEKSKISCHVDANPATVDFRWTFNNSAESNEVLPKHITRTSGTSSTVSYTPIAELDYGTLLCWATNSIGHQEIPCVYHIIAAGRPDVVHNCTINNTSKNSFFARCTGGFDGGLPQSFMMEVRDSTNHELKVNLTSTIPNFTVGNLDSGGLYQIYIYAFNDKGRSEPLIMQAGTLSLPEKQLTSDTERPRAPMKLTPLLSVMIGIVTALVIVAIIVMIVLRIQHSHAEELSKSQVEDPNKAGKPSPIQRELRFRECGSLITDEKLVVSDPFGKLDTSTGDVSETDEKNPDIIPQQISDDTSEYLRKRRLISTIETSPSRCMLERSAIAAAVGPRDNYAGGYCTINRGMPMRELSTAVKVKHKNFQPTLNEVYDSGMCTLPRQHWPNRGVQTVAMNMAPSVIYSGGTVGILSRACPGSMILTKDMDTRFAAPCCMLPTKELTIKASSPLVNKRESSV